MKKHGVLMMVAATLAVAAPACWPMEWETADQEFKDAVPEKDDVMVKIGSDDAELTSASGLLSVNAALDPWVNEECAAELCQEEIDGEPFYVDGEVYEATRSAKWYINGGLEVTLGWIAAILAQPYTEEIADGYVWGPWAESLSRIKFEFSMIKEGEDAFTFELRGKNVNAGEADPWTPVVWGNLAASGEPHASMGNIVIDYTAVHTVDTAHPTPEAGRITYAFDVRELPYTVTASFEGFEAEAGQVIDAEYAYTRYDDGMAGALTFELDADVWPEDGGDGLYEELLVTSRWTAEGEGQGEASAIGGTLDTDGSLVDELSLDECWAAQDCLFYQTFADHQAHYSDDTPDTTFDECGFLSRCPVFI